ncbi:MAG: short-chain fatty acyl-CoA regulator family protein [Neomegalonema sp.]|nr:short-chain fatty acyl-CoA regulator family protein [Neomegalonema sp.]
MARAPIGLKMRERRRALGMTQAQAAEAAGISTSYLNLIENGKRPVAGGLLRRLAQALETSLSDLDDAADGRLVEGLAELSADPILREARPSAESAADFVGRHGAWARALLLVHRAYVARDRDATTLADRLSQDPALSEAVYGMLSNVAAIRSAAEILQDGEAAGEELAKEMRGRFQSIIADESARLSEISRTLAGFFASHEASGSPATPEEEVDDFLAERRNFFPAIEGAVGELRFEAQVEEGRQKSRLIDYLEARFGVSVERAEGGARPLGLRGHAEWSAKARRLVIYDSAPEASRRFEIARIAASLAAQEAIAAEIDSAASLHSDGARERARRALGAYAAAAVLAPYDEFLDKAERTRYDIEALSRRFAISFEQAAHRTVTLRRPGAEGVPFAFMRVDPSGFVTKRLALPGLPLPRRGGACPLWIVYRAFQTPEVVQRQLAAFPSGDEFFFISRTVAKEGGSFTRPRHLLSIMLACDAVHADRLVYSDGLALGAAGHPTPVGPSCRICVRRDCVYRQEEVGVQDIGGETPNSIASVDVAS